MKVPDTSDVAGFNISHRHNRPRADWERRYKLPLSLVNWMRFDGDLKEEHKAFKFLMDVLEYQNWRGYITARQRAAVVKTCKRFGYDPSPQIEKV